MHESLKQKMSNEIDSLEELGPHDFLKIEQYGGGPDESCLKGTKNALRHLAIEIFNVTSGEPYDYEIGVLVSDDSVAGIDSIEIVEIKDGKPVEHDTSLKERSFQIFIVLLLITFLASAIFGFFTALKLLFT